LALPQNNIWENVLNGLTCHALQSVDERQKEDLKRVLTPIHSISWGSNPENRECRAYPRAEAHGQFTVGCGPSVKGEE